MEILRACFGLAVGRFEHLRAVGVADDGGTRSPSVGLFSSGVFHGAVYCWLSCLSSCGCCLAICEAAVAAVELVVRQPQQPRLLLSW